MTTKPKLTLERWAALDPVTYAPESNIYPTLMRMEERCRLHEKAAPRLLAALRGLAREWDEKESQHASSDYGKACAYEACAAQLRHLIATNDLAATATCQHNFQANYGLYDTSHRYCTKCGVAE